MIRTHAQAPDPRHPRLPQARHPVSRHHAAAGGSVGARAGDRAAGQSVSREEHRPGRRRREPRLHLRHGRRVLPDRRGSCLVRKPGKLPHKRVSMTYDLEYGNDTLEMHADAIVKGQRVLIVDDVLATGGTMKACVDLVKQLGGELAGDRGADRARSVERPQTRRAAQSPFSADVLKRVECDTGFEPVRRAGHGLKSVSRGQQ